MLALPHNVRGALWIFLAGIAFTSMMILVKYLGEGYSAALQSVFRQAAGLLILLPAIFRQGATVFATPTPRLLAVNCVVSTAALALGFYSYQVLPLAEANSLSYTRMLWLVPLAMFVAGEPMRIPRLVASLVGFGGVVVMMRPGGGGMDFGHAVALLAALMSGTSIILLKLLTRDNRPVALMVWGSTIGVLISLPVAMLDWRWPGPGDLALLMCMGLLGVATQICYIRGLEIGEAAAVTPVDYSRLVLAAGAGWVLFGEIPDGWTIVGSLVIVAATLFISWQELRAGRRQADGTPLSEPPA